MTAPSEARVNRRRVSVFNLISQWIFPHLISFRFIFVKAKI